MAIRKFRKVIKPVVWVIAVAMFLSTIAMIISNVSQNRGNKNYAFKLNGDKVSAIDVDRAIYQASENLSKTFGNTLDKNDAAYYGLSGIIDEKLILEIAKDLKVKASKGEVKEQWKAIEAQIPDKTQLKRMLQMQGFTTKSYQAKIKEQITIQKTVAKILEEAKVTDEEIKAKYEELKSAPQIAGKELKDVKADIRASIQEKKGRLELAKILGEKRNEMEITDVNAKYKVPDRKPIMNGAGIDITNLDVIQTALSYGMYGLKDYKKAKEEATRSLQGSLNLAKEAEKMGIKKTEGINGIEAIDEVHQKLTNKLIADAKPTEAEIKGFFAKNGVRYDTLPSADANILALKLDPTPADEQKVATEATELIKTLTPENFAKVAKEKSQGPSAPKGGELGWFGKGQMVPEFEKAVFATEKGKIHPKPVKTEFGYHIIYVSDKKADQVKASHILLQVKPAEATIKKVETDAAALVKELKEKKITFKDAAKKKYSASEQVKFKEIDESGMQIGNPNLAKEIFKAKLNEVTMTKAGDTGLYIFEKTKDVKAKKAKLEEVRETVISDLKTNQAMTKLQEMQKKSAALVAPAPKATTGSAVAPTTGAVEATTATAVTTTASAVKPAEKK